jgi:cell division protein ZapA (FtsZ GTPase activity inhibitor)
MSEARNVQAIQVIQIMGRELRVRSDEPSEHLQALARFVEERATQIAGPKKLDGADTHLLMATAIQLADEIHKLKAEQAELTAKLRSSSRSLLGRIDRSGARVPTQPELSFSAKA